MLSSRAMDIARRIVANSGGGNGQTSGRRLDRFNYLDEGQHSPGNMFCGGEGYPADGILTSLILNMARFKNELPPSSFMILLFLTANGDRQPISQKTIAECTGYSRSSVERSLKFLRNMGYIAVHKEIDQVMSIAFNIYDIAPLQDKLADSRGNGESFMLNAGDGKRTQLRDGV